MAEISSLLDFIRDPEKFQEELIEGLKDYYNQIQGPALERLKDKYPFSLTWGLYCMSPLSEFPSAINFHLDGSRLVMSYQEYHYGEIDHYEVYFYQDNLITFLRYRNSTNYNPEFFIGTAEKNLETIITMEIHQEELRQQARLKQEEEKERALFEFLKEKYGGKPEEANHDS